MAFEPVDVGVIGCGNISDTYFQNAALFPDIRISACADLDPAASAAKPALHGVRAASPAALLADPLIRIVINLTNPSAHAEVGLAVLAAGKHLYSEKPLCTRVGDADRVLTAARRAGLRAACAPDTVFGAAHQMARGIIDSGEIDRVVGGSACVMDRGMEAWHPDPAFFFQPGGGPVLDMGPYYLTSLVALLGPAARVTAMASTGLTDRSIGSGPRRGESFAVATATTVNASIEFESGANVAFNASWDVWQHGRQHIELYGTEGSLVLPDPNWFGGELRVSRGGGAWETRSTANACLGTPNRDDGAQRVADYRIVGVVDLAHALRENRPERANGALALHVLELMEAMATSATDGRHVDVAPACSARRPCALPRQTAGCAVPARPDAGSWWCGAWPMQRAPALAPAARSQPSIGVSSGSPLAIARRYAGRSPMRCR